MSSKIKTWSKRHVNKIMEIMDKTGIYQWAKHIDVSVVNYTIRFNLQ